MADPTNKDDNFYEATLREANRTAPPLRTRLRSFAIQVIIGLVVGLVISFLAVAALIEYIMRHGI